MFNERVIRTIYTNSFSQFKFVKTRWHLKISSGAFRSDFVTDVANVKEDTILFNTSRTSKKAVLNSLTIFKNSGISDKTITQRNKLMTALGPYVMKVCATVMAVISFLDF